MAKEYAGKEESGASYFQKVDSMIKQGDSLMTTARNSPEDDVRVRLLGGSLKFYHDAAGVISKSGALTGSRQREQSFVNDACKYFVDKLRMDKNFSSSFLLYLRNEKRLGDPEIRTLLSSPSSKSLMFYAGFERNLLGTRIADTQKVVTLLGRKQKVANLGKSLDQKIMPVLSILSFIGALFFLSLNLTGAVVGSVSAAKSQWWGLGLVGAGLVFTLLYFRRKAE